MDIQRLVQMWFVRLGITRVALLQGDAAVSRDVYVSSVETVAL